MTPKYPDVTVHLTGMDGNVFMLTAMTSKALRRHGVDASEIETFKKEVKSGDYNHALQTIMRWVETS